MAKLVEVGSLMSSCWTVATKFRASLTSLVDLDGDGRADLVLVRDDGARRLIVEPYLSRFLRHRRVGSMVLLKHAPPPAADFIQAVPATISIWILSRMSAVQAPKNGLKVVTLLSSPIASPRSIQFLGRDASFSNTEADARSLSSTLRLTRCKILHIRFAG